MRSILFVFAAMFAAAAQAFTTVPRGSTSRLGVLARSMMAEAGEGKTIVDICKEKISAALGTDDVKVVGAYDDPNGSHITVEVYSDAFEGKRPVQRQQLVYKALWEELDSNAVHAVDSMVCKTPGEK